MVETEGTVQVSNPSPLPIIPASWETAAVLTSGFPAAVVAVTAVPVTAFAVTALAVAALVLVVTSFQPVAMGACVVVVALARIVRICASSAPKVAVTRTPGPGTSIWIIWLTAAAAAVAAGSAVCRGRAALVPGSTKADAGTLAELADWMSSASVRPYAWAGQSWALPGVPR